MWVLGVGHGDAKQLNTSLITYIIISILKESGLIKETFTRVFKL